MTKKTKSKPRAKKLSKAHRDAISKAMTKPVTELARSAPRDVLAALREGIRASLTADDLAAALGTSRTLFYREVIPVLGGSIEAIKDLVKREAETDHGEAGPHPGHERAGSRHESPAQCEVRPLRRQFIRRDCHFGCHVRPSVETAQNRCCSAVGKRCARSCSTERARAITVLASSSSPRACSART